MIDDFGLFGSLTACCVLRDFGIDWSWSRGDGLVDIEQSRRFTEGRVNCMALSVLALLVVAFAVAVWFATAVHNDVPALCSRPDKASLDTKPACLFSSDYDTARWRFREAVTDARNAELFSIDVAEGLSTDVALFNREACARGVLLHTSGVHGVEGFVGSAVQLGMVPLLANDSTTCVVLVHAVNPFGFAHLRRCNEHGVDLNRNALFDERAWREVLERDPNVAGYADVRDLVNPPHAPSGVALAVARIAVTVARHGMAKLKAAIVTGTYTCASCLFYGGRSLQRSHALLAQFLRDQKVCRAGVLCSSPLISLFARARSGVTRHAARVSH